MAKNNAKVNNKKSTMDPIGQLRQIKEIIFGPEMDEMLKRIEDLETKMEDHQKATSDKISKTKLSLGQNL
ncbi:MAG: hypothetical protein AAF696_05895, partial [Bacteroidota bacterium]